MNDNETTDIADANLDQNKNELFFKAQERKRLMANINRINLNIARNELQKNQHLAMAELMRDEALQTIAELNLDLEESMFFLESLENEKQN